MYFFVCQPPIFGKKEGCRNLTEFSVVQYVGFAEDNLAKTPYSSKKGLTFEMMCDKILKNF